MPSATFRVLLLCSQQLLMVFDNFTEGIGILFDPFLIAELKPRHREAELFQRGTTILVIRTHIPIGKLYSCGSADVGLIKGFEEVVCMQTVISAWGTLCALSPNSRTELCQGKTAQFFGVVATVGTTPLSNGLPAGKKKLSAP